MNGYAKPFWWLLATAGVLTAAVWGLAQNSQASVNNDVNRRLTNSEEQIRDLTNSLADINATLGRIDERTQWLDRLKK